MLVGRVPADMPLYDILNEFQKGSSHMAAVVKSRGKIKTPPPTHLDGSSEVKEANGDARTPLLSKLAGGPGEVVIGIEKGPDDEITATPKLFLQPSDAAGVAAAAYAATVQEDIEDGEVIGIITLEDVFEELLQVNPTLLRSQCDLFWVISFSPSPCKLTEPVINSSSFFFLI